MNKRTASLMCLGAVAGFLLALPAQAAETSWSADKCGHEPDAPSVETASVDKYNASVDRVSAYQNAARAFDACVAKEANRQETAISDDARARIAHVHDASVAVHSRIAANFTTQNAALKSASRKLGGN